MPYIPLKENLPGITGLLDYRTDTALPVRQLTQIRLRGASGLPQGEGELIASFVCSGNECRFCNAAHGAIAGLYPGDTPIAEEVKNNMDTAPVSKKMKALVKKLPQRFK